MTFAENVVSHLQMTIGISQGEKTNRSIVKNVSLRSIENGRKTMPNIAKHTDKNGEHRTKNTEERIQAKLILRTRLSLLDITQRLRYLSVFVVTKVESSFLLLTTLRMMGISNLFHIEEHFTPISSKKVFQKDTKCSVGIAMKQRNITDTVLTILKYRYRKG